MCNSCEVMSINGTNCHEIGCPDAYKDYPKDCYWCGQAFKPEYERQEYCCDECYQSDNN